MNDGFRICVIHEYRVSHPHQVCNTRCEHRTNNWLTTCVKSRLIFSHAQVLQLTLMQKIFERERERERGGGGREPNFQIWLRVPCCLRREGIQTFKCQCAVQPDTPSHKCSSNSAPLSKPQSKSLQMLNNGRVCFVTHNPKKGKTTQINPP